MYVTTAFRTVGDGGKIYIQLLCVNICATLLWKGPGVHSANNWGQFRVVLCYFCVVAVKCLLSDT